MMTTNDYNAHDNTDADNAFDSSNMRTPQHRTSSSRKRLSGVEERCPPFRLPSFSSPPTNVNYRHDGNGDGNDDDDDGEGLAAAAPLHVHDGNDERTPSDSGRGPSGRYSNLRDLLELDRLQRKKREATNRSEGISIDLPSKTDVGDVADGPRRGSNHNRTNPTLNALPIAGYGRSMNSERRPAPRLRIRPNSSPPPAETVILRSENADRSELLCEIFPSPDSNRFVLRLPNAGSQDEFQVEDEEEDNEEEVQDEPEDEAMNQELELELEDPPPPPPMEMLFTPFGDEPQHGPDRPSDSGTGASAVPSPASTSTSRSSSVPPSARKTLDVHEKSRKKKKKKKKILLKPKRSTLPREEVEGGSVSPSSSCSCSDDMNDDPHRSNFEYGFNGGSGPNDDVPGDEGEEAVRSFHNLRPRNHVRTDAPSSVLRAPNPGPERGCDETGDVVMDLHPLRSPLGRTSTEEEINMAKEAAMRFGGRHGRNDSFSPDVSEGDFRTPRREEGRRFMVRGPLCRKEDGGGGKVDDLLLPSLFSSTSEDQDVGMEPSSNVSGGGVGRPASFLSMMMETFSPKTRM